MLTACDYTVLDAFRSYGNFIRMR